MSCGTLAITTEMVAVKSASLTSSTVWIAEAPGMLKTVCREARCQRKDGVSYLFTGSIPVVGTKIKDQVAKLVRRSGLAFGIGSDRY